MFIAVMIIIAQQNKKQISTSARKGGQLPRIYFLLLFVFPFFNVMEMRKGKQTIYIKKFCKKKNNNEHIKVIFASKVKKSKILVKHTNTQYNFSKQSFFLLQS